MTCSYAADKLSLEGDNALLDHALESLSHIFRTSKSFLEQKLAGFTRTTGTKTPSQQALTAIFRWEDSRRRPSWRDPWTTRCSSLARRQIRKDITERSTVLLRPECVPRVKCNCTAGPPWPPLPTSGQAAAEGRPYSCPGEWPKFGPIRRVGQNSLLTYKPTNSILSKRSNVLASVTRFSEWRLPVEYSRFPRLAVSTAVCARSESPRR